ncbi:bifunctional endoribonuclease/protein kinase ire1 [Cymbomonas tetramitiformis]|uniref:non-specific serine/threonine protein kinase n=1 Tax=Cymbomonas tetramitiformis TaxID=36881 RepID=A0AAE0FFZ4_9CHLO|nr:bifunctional endoribonuclease/protein kinase ire1 [Cymbomonas tetramitiformis]
MHCPKHTAIVLLLFIFLRASWSARSPDTQILSHIPIDGASSLAPFKSEERLGNDRSSLHYLSLLDGTLRAVDGRNGEILWSFDSGGPLVSSWSLKPADADAAGTTGHVFADTDGNLYEYQRNKPQPERVSKMPYNAKQLVEFTPSLTPDGVVMYGKRQTTVFALDREGILKREFSFDSMDTQEAMDTLMPGDRNGPTIFVGRTDFVVHARDASTMAELWNVSYSQVAPLGSRQNASPEQSNFIPHSSHKLPPGAQQEWHSHGPEGAGHGLALSDCLVEGVDEHEQLWLQSFTDKGEHQWSMPLDTPARLYTQDSFGDARLTLPCVRGKRSHFAEAVPTKVQPTLIGMLPRGGGMYAHPVGNAERVEQAAQLQRSVPVPRLPGAVTTSKRGPSTALMLVHPSFQPGGAPPWQCADTDLVTGLHTLKDQTVEGGSAAQPRLPTGGQQLLPGPAQIPPAASVTHPILVAAAASMMTALAFAAALWRLRQLQPPQPLSEAEARAAAEASDSEASTVAEVAAEQPMEAAMVGDSSGSTADAARSAPSANAEPPPQQLLANGAVQVGRLQIGPGVLGYGCAGTIVFEGMLDGRQVAVKRLLNAFQHLASKENQALVLSDHHPSVLRCFAMEEDSHFCYLALERCAGTLADLLADQGAPGSLDEAVAGSGDSARRPRLPSSLPEHVRLLADGSQPTETCLRIMHETTLGLVALHELGIAHRDLKPHNLLLTVDLRVKISDMGFSKSLDTGQHSFNTSGGGSTGWQAPEQLVAGRQTRAVDLFSLGCLTFYSASNGLHPFGAHHHRDSNIVKNVADLRPVDHLPELQHLVAALISYDPALRPSAAAAAIHPTWWSPSTRLDFLQEVSDHMELEDRADDARLLEALERGASKALGFPWDARVDGDLLTGKHRKYNPGCLRDLLRLVRNKRHHYRELPADLQARAAPHPATQRAPRSSRRGGRRGMHAAFWPNLSPCPVLRSVAHEVLAFGVCHGFKRNTWRAALSAAPLARQYGY